MSIISQQKPLRGQLWRLLHEPRALEITQSDDNRQKFAREKHNLQTTETA